MHNIILKRQSSEVQSLLLLNNKTQVYTYTCVFVNFILCFNNTDLFWMSESCMLNWLFNKDKEQQ